MAPKTHENVLLSEELCIVNETKNKSLQKKMVCTCTMSSFI